MNLKKLTQAVFEGLPPEYRWAAVDADGSVHCFHEPPIPTNSGEWIYNKYLICEDWHDVATDWKNSRIERQDVLTAADIDWSTAPEGATHWHDDVSAWYKIVDDSVFIYSDYDDVWVLSAYETSDIDFSQDFITRPESIHDVARSIEAARVAEQSERTYPHYFKDVSGVDAIDLYHVARLYDINDPALFHAFKKIACAGKRGSKDQAQDVQEAIDALKRWQELNV